MGNHHDVRFLPLFANISPVALRTYNEFAEFAKSICEYFSSSLKDLRHIREKSRKSFWTEFA